jgi:thiol-disulfide isomerase/thioredoxin
MTSETETAGEPAPATGPAAQPAAAAKRRKGPLIAALAGLGALAAVYGFAGLARNPGDPACRAAVDLARKLEPLARGELAAVRPAEEARKLPVLAFQNAGGETKTLADWKGRTVLVNLWATWCIPCRKEMPALDALQEKLGSPQFEVVAVNIDTRNLDKPKAWLHDIGAQHLAYYADSNAKVFQDLKAVGKAIGMPTTLLVDPNGCEIASLAGPAEWASPDGVKLVTAAMGK